MVMLRTMFVGIGLAVLLLLMLISSGVAPKKNLATDDLQKTVARIYFTNHKEKLTYDRTVERTASHVQSKDAYRADVNQFTIRLSEALEQAGQIAQMRHIDPSDLKALIRQNAIPGSVDNQDRQVNLLALNLCLDLQSVNHHDAHSIDIGGL